MVDNLKNRGPQDRARVNVNEPWEVKQWCQAFSCTESQLKAAVKAVGPMVNDVSAWLIKNKK